MANITGGLTKMKEAVQGMTQDKKIKDLARDTSDVHAPATITTDHGTKVSNTDNWLKSVDDHRTGPSLLEDQIAREKIHRFDHERIPERVVHARGTGAFGHFMLLESASDVTSAGVLTDTSRTTPVFVRFSTVQGSRGSADTVRDVRGFAVKFYTDEGNWDLVGNNIPVFFIQDAMKFPDFVHAVKPEPHNEVPQAQTAHNNFWDFVYLHPEATHMFMWAMSDRAIPRSYRMMQGFGVNTYVLVNNEGKRHFVKFHWMPELGVHSLVWDECLKVAGQDPDFHRLDGQMRHRIHARHSELLALIDSKPFPQPTSKENSFVTYPSKVSGIKARSLSKKFREHINQAQLFYNSLSEPEKLHVKKAFAFELDHCDDPIVYNRLVERLTEIDLDLAQSVAVLAGAPTPQKETRPNKGEKTINLSQAELNQKYAATPSIKSRRIAILIGDGYDAVAFVSAKTAIKAAGALPFIIGTKRQAIFADHEDPNKEKGVIPDHHYDGQRSTMFDATFVPGGSHVKNIGKIGQIRHWIAESFGHLKPIGATGEAVNLVAQALSAVPEVEVADASDGQVVESYGVVTSGRLHEPESLTEGIKIIKEATDFLGKFFYQVYQFRNFDREMEGLVDRVAF
ncbi:catalase A [Uncinocarpus reesii 1704]|uniref:catalase n=1 Tax=Uncinocarpus reesii (strain UAMH 1704) TaxID=336963 RepID=C4JR77_UNCRE|nr:catalase A [Uncinocarpus reesii 1704]EEP78713.1 catalase A [Uncinocarpus reesii 1704]